MLAAIGDRPATEGVNLSFAISASDPDATTPSFTTSTLPTGASFVDNGNGTGTFNWVPGFTQSGSYPVTFRATDGALVDSEVVTITAKVTDPQGVASVTLQYQTGSGATFAGTTLPEVESPSYYDLDGTPVKPGETVLRQVTIAHLLTNWDCGIATDTVVVTANQRPQVVSVRPRVFELPAADAGRTGQVVRVAPALAEGEIPTRVLEVLREEGGVNLTEAKVIIAGGRGVGEGLADVIWREGKDKAGDERAGCAVRYRVKPDSGYYAGLRSCYENRWGFGQRTIRRHAFLLSCGKDSELWRQCRVHPSARRL